MGVAMVQMRLARVGGLTEDVVVNTFHFITPTPGQVTPTEAGTVQKKVSDFYTGTWAPSTQPVRNWLGNGIANTGHETRVYDLQQPKPRAPILNAFHTITPGTSMLPAEVAICLSYRAPLVSGTNPRRRRGRIYIGPLSQGAVSGATAGDARPDTAMTAAILNAAKGSLMEDVGVGDWAVASEPEAGGPLTLVPITHCWVDNAFDTQKRRGGKPTSRTTIDA